MGRNDNDVLTDKHIERAKELYETYTCGFDGLPIWEALAKHQGRAEQSFKSWKQTEYGDERKGGVSPRTFKNHLNFLKLIRNAEVGQILADVLDSFDPSINTFNKGLERLDKTIKIIREYIEKVKLRPKDLSNSLDETDWAVYFLFYQHENERHINEGLIGRAILNVRDSEKFNEPVEFTHTPLDSVINYEGTYTPHMDMDRGYVQFDLEAADVKEKGRTIHIRVYCRSREQELAIGQFTSYEKSTIQSGTVVLHNITKLKNVEPGAFSFKYKPSEFIDDKNIDPSLIEFLSIRLENYHVAADPKLDTFDKLKAHLANKRQFDDSRFERFLERTKPKVFIASAASDKSVKPILEEMKTHLDSTFNHNLHVSFKPTRMVQDTRKEIDENGARQPHRDIQKLRRTRFFVLVLDKVQKLSYSYLQLGIAITVCKVVVVIGKKKMMSETIFNLRDEVITKIEIPEDATLKTEFPRVLDELVEILKQKLPKTEMLDGYVKIS